MRRAARLILASVFLPLFAAQAETTSFVVPGTSDMWLSGMPDGSTASGSDSAPAHSPVLAHGADLGLEFLTFIVSGGVSHTGSCTPTNCSTPDGDEFWNHSDGAQNGLADVRAPLDALMGVFLAAEQPDASAAPTGLDFEVMGLDFAELRPELKQVFFIGDGLTGTGAGDLQRFFVPDGAQRLFLGSMDGFGWHNNNGAFEVVVPTIPLPPALWLFASAGAGLVWWRRRAKQDR